MTENITGPQPKVIVIILLYNGMKWIDGCLQSLSKTRYSNFEILLIDNGSTDDCARYARQHFPFVKQLSNARNEGTARGNNRGIRYALDNGAQYVSFVESGHRGYR
jgi:GT2 family glycosyltransferase